MPRRAVANRASLPGIRRTIRAELAQAGADPASSFDCLVAVTEACTNALFQGGAESGDDHAPEIRWEIGDEEACFYVEDFLAPEWTAMAAHPSRVSQEVTKGELERRAATFELELMRGLMDEVELDVSPSVSTLRLRKHL